MLADSVDAIGESMKIHKNYSILTDILASLYLSMVILYAHNIHFLSSIITRSAATATIFPLRPRKGSYRLL